MRSERESDASGTPARRALALTRRSPFAAAREAPTVLGRKGRSPKDRSEAETLVGPGSGCSSLTKKGAGRSPLTPREPEHLASEAKQALTAPAEAAGGSPWVPAAWTAPHVP